MAQKLILPLNTMGLTASYDRSTSSAYAVEFGQPHWGCDSWGNSTIYGLGTGRVVAKGFNTFEGYYVCVRYNSVIKPSGGTFDVIIRYFHMANACPVAVSTSSDNVTKDTALGTVGNSGKWAFGATHLHMEMDTDVNYPTYTPSITSAQAGGGLNAGYRGSQDTTVNPLAYLYCKETSPDNQSIFNRDGNDNTYVYASDYVNFRQY